MRFPVDTPQQLRTVLRALRQSRRMTQMQLGERMGVNQKRIARIEAAPELTSFDQIARLVAALGGRLNIAVPETALPDASIEPVRRPGAARSPDSW